MKIKIVGVRFKPGGKVYYFDTTGLEIHRGDPLVVQTAQGIEYGEAALAPKTIDEASLQTPAKPVLRVATEEDRQDYQVLKEKEKEARRVFDERARANELDMKLINVSFTFDRKKAIFYFTADGRLDFRKLVRELASIFHLRIELRQIGVRDEVKMFHTLGICGRETCCSKWLDNFRPVSIKMAKEQGLSLNSSKISGVCGRLLCCLTYEDEFYHDVTKRMPKIGNWVTTPEGEGQVYRLNVLEEKVLVKMQTDSDELEIKTFGMDEVVKSGNKHVQANNRRQQQKRQEDHDDNGDGDVKNAHRGRGKNHRDYRDDDRYEGKDEHRRLRHRHHPSGRKEARYENGGPHQRQTVRGAKRSPKLTEKNAETGKKPRD